jgi:hypothetical protein
MRSSTILIGVAIGFLGLSLEAWAGGNAPPPSCQVDRQPGGSKVIAGTATMTVYNYDGSAGDVDALLRLEYLASGAQDDFRAHVFTNVLSGEDLICQILAVNPTNSTGHTIKQAFGIPDRKSLVITGPPQNPETSVRNLGFGSVPGGPTGDSSGIADVRIFVK